MCGIAGIIGTAADGAIDTMVAHLAHRGPDDRGVFRDPNGECALGQTRLAVIEPSAAGHQPMAYGERYRVVFNGEIYNYLELRKTLEDLGHRFMTSTDTEVILAAYAEWGAACASRFRGMFALALWDMRERELFLARDRLGIKPLLVTSTNGRFVFCSELRPMLAAGIVERVADRQAVLDFLSLGSVPQPRTIVAGVSMFPPGHHAVVRSGRMTTSRYWSYRDICGEPRAAADGMAPARLRSLLEDATRLHLIADVPLGAFLSGGIDSRIVVGLMSRLVSSPIRTFTVGFEGVPGFPDERAAAEETARDFGCSHEETVLSAAGCMADLDTMLADIDQPSVDGFNTWFVSRAARTSVVVALSGLGGDELFAGYRHFRDHAAAARIAPGGVRQLRWLATALRDVPPRRIGRAIERLVADPAGRIAMLRRLGTNGQTLAMLRPSFGAAGLRSIEDYCMGLVAATGDAVNDISIAEVEGYLRNTLLRDSDVMSMAHALEVRPVLLDHKVVEFAASLPGEAKADRVRGKKLLIDACRDLLPIDVERRRKLGFELPLVRWIAERDSDRVVAALGGPTSRSMFTDDFLCRARAAIADGGRNRCWWPAFLLTDFLDRHALAVEDAA